MGTAQDDLLRAFDDRLAALDAEIAQRQEERDRVARARAALVGDLTADYRHGNNQGMASYSVAPEGKHQQSKRAPAGERAQRFLREYAWPAGILSLRDLANRMKANATKRGGASEDRNITHSHLSQALNGEYPMSRDRCERIRELTKSAKHPEGFEATRRNWRGLKLPTD